MGKVQILRDSKDRPLYAVLFWKDYIELIGEDAQNEKTVVKNKARARKKAKR